MTIPAPGQNPRYDKHWETCIDSETNVFFTRVYAGILPAYPHTDLDIWIHKPGHVDVQMQPDPSHPFGTAVNQPPLTQWRVSMSFNNFSAQGRGAHTEEEFFADSPDEIVLIMALSYNIPVKKIGWDF